MTDMNDAETEAHALLAAAARLESVEQELAAAHALCARQREELAEARAEAGRLREAMRKLLQASELLVQDYAKQHRVPVKLTILRSVLEAGAARRALYPPPAETKETTT